MILTIASKGKRWERLIFFEMKTDEEGAYKINCMVETYYVMKLVASWMKLKGLVDANTKRDWKENRVRKSIQYIYKQPFGVKFRYKH